MSAGPQIRCEVTWQQLNLGCRDLSVLERWLTRAVTAASESDFIAA